MGQRSRVAMTVGGLRTRREQDRRTDVGKEAGDRRRCLDEICRSTGRSPGREEFQQVGWVSVERDRAFNSLLLLPGGGGGFSIRFLLLWL